MLAVSGGLPGDPENWALELKWDGVRALAEVAPEEVRVYARRGVLITSTYPELSALADLLAGHRAVLDGEVVAFEDGRPSFHRLQRRMHASRPSSRLIRSVPVRYMVFDLLELDGMSLLDLPYVQRRALLQDLELAAGPIEVAALPPGLRQGAGRGAAGLHRAGAAGGPDRQTAGLPLSAGEAGLLLAEDQELPHPGGPGRRLAYRQGPQGGHARLAAARRPRPGAAAVRRACRHRLRRRRARRAGGPSQAAGAPRLAGRGGASSGDRQGLPLGRARPGRRGRLHRVDGRRQGPPPVLAGPALGQGPPRRGPDGRSRMSRIQVEVEGRTLTLSNLDKPMYPEGSPRAR